MRQLGFPENQSKRCLRPLTAMGVRRIWSQLVFPYVRKGADPVRSSVGTPQYEEEEGGEEAGY